MARWIREGPRAGVYVVQFPGRVKIGLSCHVPHRVGGHRTDGATRALGFHTKQCDLVEGRALSVLAERANRIRATESFTGISFAETAGVLRMVISAVTGCRPEVIVNWTKGTP